MQRLAVTAVEDCHASTKVRNMPYMPYISVLYRPSYTHNCRPIMVLQLLATTVLRSEVGRRNLSVLLADRVGLAADIKVGC